MSSSLTFPFALHPAFLFAVGLLRKLPRVCVWVWTLEGALPETKERPPDPDFFWVCDCAETWEARLCLEDWLRRIMVIDFTEHKPLMDKVQLYLYSVGTMVKKSSWMPIDRLRR